MIKSSLFKFSLFYPKYWSMWTGICLLYLIVQLPYSILYHIGNHLGSVARFFMLKRVDIVRCNLKLCFPKMSILEREKLLKQNFKSIGMGLIETGMAWFWSDRRIKRWFKVIGLENIEKAKKERKGILLIGLHFLTLELGARIFGIFNPGIGVYRPNNNKLLDWLQTWGRLRSNKRMINRANIRSIIRSLKNKEIIWYAPDQDYGYKNSVFVPLFNVSHAATTIGTYIFIYLTKPAIIPLIPRRLPNKIGYELLILSDVNKFPCIDSTTTAIYMNKLIEKMIMFAPEQYMWLHRRFKTRPPGKNHFYKEKN